MLTKDECCRSPAEFIQEQELSAIILKMGSFLSILQNNKMNQAKLFIYTVQNKQFQKLFLNISDVSNVQLLVQNIIQRYPTLCKSKYILNSLKK